MASSSSCQVGSSGPRRPSCAASARSTKYSACLPRTSSANPEASSCSTAKLRIIRSIPKPGTAPPGSEWTRLLSISDESGSTRSPRLGRADGLDRFEREAAHEHAQPREQVLLGVVEQAVAPEDRVAHGLLALGQVGPARSRELERVVEAAKQVLRLHQLDARGRELDRQRQAVQAVTDLRHGRRVVLIDLEVGTHRLGAVDEKADGVVLAHARVDAVVGQAERLDGKLPFGLEPQRRPARDHDREAGAGGQEIRHHRLRAPELLEVVEDQQRSPVAQVVAHDVGRIDVAVGAGRAAHAEAEKAHDRGRYTGRVLHGVERYEEHPSREALRGAAGGLDRQPRLAHAAGAGEGDEPVLALHQELEQSGHLFVPPDESARRRGDGAAQAGLPAPLLLLLPEAFGEQREQILGDDRLELLRGLEGPVGDAPLAPTRSSIFSRPSSRLGAAASRTSASASRRTGSARPRGPRSPCRGRSSRSAPSRSPRTRGSARGRRGRGCARGGRAPCSNMTGASWSDSIARRTAWRSSASSPRVELTKTRRRWSGVRITCPTVPTVVWLSAWQRRKDRARLASGGRAVARDRSGLRPADGARAAPVPDRPAPRGGASRGGGRSTTRRSGERGPPLRRPRAGQVVRRQHRRKASKSDHEPRTLRAAASGRG